MSSVTHKPLLSSHTEELCQCIKVSASECALPWQQLIYLSLLSAVFHLWAVQEVAELDPFVSRPCKSGAQKYLNTLSREKTNTLAQDQTALRPVSSQAGKTMTQAKNYFRTHKPSFSLMWLLGLQGLPVILVCIFKPHLLHFIRNEEEMTILLSFNFIQKHNEFWFHSGNYYN